MARFSEETLTNWTKPPSDTEEDKLSNSERMVKEAINEDPILSSKSIEIFGQGSYANNTNVKINSDIDINVQFTGGFYYYLPPNMSKDEFGIGGDMGYSIEEFKNDVQTALINKFGNESVRRKNKCITVLGNSYRVETDVVPTWNHRRYEVNGDYVLGARISADDRAIIENYPKQHISNGVDKNSNTLRKFKRLTRIFRKLRYKMIEDGEDVSDSITSFLLECLVWNVPNPIFSKNATWQELLKASIAYIYEHTEDESKCDEWGEVSELLHLFYGRKWSKKDVNKFTVDAWNYLGY